MFYKGYKTINDRGVRDFIRDYEQLKNRRVKNAK